jgi:hypothetical protein
VGKEIEKTGGAKRGEVATIFSLIGKETRGDTRGEIDFIAQTEFSSFRLVLVTAKKGGGGGGVFLRDDLGGLPRKGGRWGRGWSGQWGGVNPAQRVTPAFAADSWAVSG